MHCRRASLSDIPFEAYQGNEPYIFISYAHKDKGWVYPAIKKMHDAGYRIWYDEGIDPGNEWPDSIARALGRCHQFVVFISPRSVASHNVQNEIHFAISRKKPFLAIHIEPTELPPSIELQTGIFQAIMAWKMSEDQTWKAVSRGLSPETQREAFRASLPPAPAGSPSSMPAAMPPDSPKFPFFLRKYRLALMAGAAVLGMVLMALVFSGSLKRGSKKAAPPAASVSAAPAPPARTPPSAEAPAPEPMKAEPPAPAMPAQENKPPEPPAPAPPKPAAAVDPQIAREEEEGLLPEMVLIPAGTFTMGCVDGRDDQIGGCFDNERPAHRVSVSPFKISKTEITVRQFRHFVQATKYRTVAEQKGTCCVFSGWGKCANRAGASWKNPGYAIMDEHPVNCISYEDAIAYVDWLRRKTNRTYRLPTEAEWEYAARGGNDSTLFPWGNTIGYNRMNCSMDHCSDNFERPSPVGSFAPNPFGLFDMHGNLWEWVQDCWHDNYDGAPANGDAWSTAFCEKRLLRGGSWNITPRFLRSARRGKQPPNYREDDIGIRVAMDL